MFIILRAIRQWLLAPASVSRVVNGSSSLESSAFGVVLLVGASLLVCAAAAGSAAAPPGKTCSRLWGCCGELWTPKSRLPDFSMAGYRRGEEPFHMPAEQISVADFGARGDDRADDTAAFQKAIAAGAGKVILVPPGRYLLSDILRISVSNLVLRGAGPDKTTLIFTRPGDVLDPRPARTDGNQPTTGWSWAGGLISIGGPERRSDVAVAVAAEATRGDLSVQLESCPFRPGEEIVLWLFDDKEKSLLDYLYRGQPGNISGLNNWKVCQVFRVVAVEGRKVLLDRPLRFDVRLRWRPRAERFVPGVTDVAVIGFCFEFPAEQYQGHFREKGWNPVEITRTAAHCLLSDLLIRNADSGPYVSGTFCTLERICLQADPARVSSRGYTGHHGISLYGNDCLCQDFSVETRFIHDLTVQSAIGCVFSHGRAVDLSMDHHRWAPYENLYTDIDAGAGRRLFASSGGGMRGHHTAGGATFWNIRTDRPVRWPAGLATEGVNIVGVNIADAAQAVPRLPEPTELRGRWLEVPRPERLHPPNLYQAMRARRRGPSLEPAGR